MANSIKSELSFSDTVKKYSDRFSQVAAHSARAMYDISERQRQQQNALNEMLAEVAEEKRQYQELQTEGAKANIESRDQLIEQNELLRKQLTEQTEINQNLKHEFTMGAREAAITRRKANWSLGIGIAGLFVAIIAAVVGVMK